MYDTQLKNYLFDNHYKSWPVQTAIKPYSTYQEYYRGIPSASDDVIIAFGEYSGKTVPREDAVYIKIFPDENTTEHYYIHKSEVFLFTTHERVEESSYNPEDYICCVDVNNGRAYHPNEIVYTTDSNFLPKSRCLELCDTFYWNQETDKPLWAPTTRIVQTYHEELILKIDAVYCQSDDDWYHRDNIEHLSYNHDMEYYVNSDDSNVHFCEDTESFALENDCYYCEDTGNHYFFENNVAARDPRRSIQDYHCGVEPDFKLTPLDPNNPLSKYTVGFEVEKDCLNDGSTSAGSLIEEQPLFSHWETDSSCGIEGITNVYSLDNLEQFNRDVILSTYLNLETNSRCGGHINIAHRENKLKYWHIRPWLGLIFSMWKKRLNNQYASCNKKLNPYRGTEFHYGTLVEKNRNRNRARFEIRLPNKVTNQDCIKRRFKLMQNLVECIDHYINEDFVWMSAKHDDKIIGIPNWITRVTTPDNNCIDQLLINISPQTRERTRFLFEKARDVIEDAYNPDQYLRLLIYAYAFQSFIDEEQPSNIVADLTDSYINN